MPRPNFYHILSFCALTGSVPNKILLFAQSQSICNPQTFWAGYATACNHFYTDGLHLSRARHVLLQYHAFQTALFYLMFNLPMTKSSQQRKTARHCRTPMKSSIVILVLRSKQYYRVVTVR